MNISENMGELKRTHYMTQIGTNHENMEVTVMGWVAKRRNLGGMIFIDLRDRTGILQAVFSTENIDDETYKKAEMLRNEFVVAIKGKVALRTGTNINESMETGYVEVIASDLKILSSANTPPFQIDDNVDVRDDLRLKYRYLDLRRPELTKKLITRHKIAASFREFLNAEGFIELETPMLTKSTPEGARDYLVASRIHTGCFYALPQSPQIFKQLLMCSGFDKYYQITKCFRDEDLRADRQPEFTQVDIEMSFVDVDDVIGMNERLLKKVFKDVLDIDIETPIKRFTYMEAMERFGSDKPDLRFGIELINLSDIVRDCSFKVFSDSVKEGSSVRAINAKGLGTLSRKQIDALGDNAKEYGAKGLAWLVINEDGSIKSPIAKFLDEKTISNIVSAMNGEGGDLILFIADKNSVVFNTLGNLRLDVAKKLELLDKNVYKLCVVTDFPLVEWNEEQNRYQAMHHMFTSPNDDQIDLLGTDAIGKVNSKSYDMCLNGSEIGGGSIRIHRRDVQQKIFDALGFTKEQTDEQFGFMLGAFDYGVPPHGGIAYGLDRVAMIMTQSDTIRDVIAFPKVKDASCPLTDAPSLVSDAQLDELSLIVKQEKSNG